MNPVPVKETVKVWPELAVGRLAGVMPVTVAPGESTVTLKVTTIVAAGEPHVMLTVPVKTEFGTAAANTNGLKDTVIWLPKLYAKPFN